MRVLHVTNGFEQDGTGITNVIVGLASEQVVQGHSVTIVCYGRGLHSSPTDVDDIVALEFIRKHGRIGTLLRTAVAIRRHFRNADQDVVHVHTVRAALAVLIAGRSAQCRSISTVHNSFQRSSLATLLMARTVFVSNGAKVHLLRYLWPLRTLRKAAISVIPNGVARDESEKELIAAARLPRKTIVYVGGHQARKGVDLLFQYLARARQLDPEVRLDVFGNADNPKLPTLADAAGVADIVSFRGFTAHPQHWMRAAAAVAIPSRNEPYGLVAAEAQLVGARIVASRTGGLIEILSSDARATLVGIGDTEAWARALVAAVNESQCSTDPLAFPVSTAKMAAEYETIYRVLCN